MKFYEVLKKYYDLSQLRIIPRMFKRIEIVGLEYIEIYEEDVLNERECFENIVGLIKRPCYCFYYPDKIEIPKDASLTEVSQRVFEVIEKIYKQSQKAEDILMNSLSNEELYIFKKALSIKLPHMIDELTDKYCYNPNDVISVLITYFDKEIKEFYKGKYKELTLRDIISAVREAIMNDFYEQGYSFVVREKMKKFKQELIAKVS